jgi:hypothetical protein
MEEKLEEKLTMTRRKCSGELEEMPHVHGR